MKIIRIENKRQSLPAPIRAVYCESFLCRLRGLMFQSRLAYEEGLLLVEKHDSRLGATIHLLFLTLDLAVIWINSLHVVVDTTLARSWHPFYAPHRPARYILEIHPNRLNEFRIGDQVEFQNG
jgi:uncharacterized membrane protein (UPF0127 family)